MTITLRGENKFGPFNPPGQVELPDFCVITGENGSGKTQLLWAIAQGVIPVSVNETALSKQDIVYLKVLEPKLDLTYHYPQATQIEDGAVQQFKGHPMRRGDRSEMPVVKLACSALSKNVEDLLEDELRAFALEATMVTPAPSVPPNLALVSEAYLRKWYHKTRAAAAVAIGQSEMEPLANLKLEPIPPWTFASDMLRQFGFSVEGPNLSRKSAETDLHLVFRNEGGHQVPPSSLSGGEQCLLAIALEQYKAASGTFPKLLLLDESLSPLHPSVLRKALHAIEETLSVERGIRTIIASHSPTLVALTKEDNLRSVRKVGQDLVIEITTIDMCLDQLTVAVPAMRFDLKNRRQVFVEAQLDEFIYTRIFSALRKNLEGEVSLQFIAAGRDKGSGGCDVAISLVDRLRPNGVGTAYCLLDCDDKRVANPASGVFVIGQGSRYAIENILLDPLIVLIVLAQTEKGRSSGPGITTSAVRSLPPKDLQAAVDKVVEAIFRHMPSGVPTEVVTSTYINGLSLTLPLWIFRSRGKEYASAVVAAFPCLKRHRAGPNNSDQDQLLGAIAADTLLEWSDFLPESCLASFRSLVAAKIASQ